MPGSAIGQVLLDLATAGERVPRDYQFESVGSRWLHREDARTRGRHHGRMLMLLRDRESNTPHDAEYDAKLHWLSGYASSSVYGDRTCSDSLPQVSTDTPNAFCNVKPTRDTALLSPAM